MSPRPTHFRRRRHERGLQAAEAASALGAADWLGLAAAPTFAIMALLTAVLGGGPLDMLCSATQETSPLGGMVPMYLLMSAFHSVPWLKLICALRGAGGKARDRGESAPGVMSSQAR